MNGEGSTGKVGVAPGNGEIAGLEGAANTICPIFALDLAETVPPRYRRFRLRFFGDEGRGVFGVLLTAACNAVASVLTGSLGSVVRVFPAPAEGNGMNRPALLFWGHADLDRAVVVHRRKGRIENPATELPPNLIGLLVGHPHERAQFIHGEGPEWPP